MGDTVSRGGDQVLITLDGDNGQPVYRQIVDQVRFQIASGLLPAGAELPSTRLLAQELGVNPMTVSKSYGVLEEEGWLERRPGLPLVVAERSEAEAGRERIAELRSLLRPVVLAARQLGLDADEAAEVFRREIMGAESEEERTG